MSAAVRGLLSTRLQISGGGVDTQLEQTLFKNTIDGDVTVSEVGKVTLTLVGNLTHRTYACASFSVSARSAGAKPTPTHQRTPSKSPKPGGHTALPGSGPTLPSGIGSGAGAGIGPGEVPTTQPLGSNPFSLPSLAPNGSGIGFQYPTPDPQIAEPAAKRVRADDASASTPIKWGQSIAAALVLLLLSAHFGMWSRRQRLAAEARAAQIGSAGEPAGGRGPGSVRRRRRPPVTELATTATVTSGAAGTGDAGKSTAARNGYRGRRRRG
ncbi:hypothetical protein NE235_09730 [Actinoallomurus spadix]|uniref:hypothetical protein n=1 Tax=Actinoallomurus spadix TaxID=79912 RepID=UPI002093CE27|nr:hypothetical protein [Actinoallomurus spadix]MCO5986386.1 hypothetical protein [Actinoallomurus spadix]